MGIISVEQTDRLYWLGRYSERVYTTIRLFSSHYDTMIDEIEASYGEYCGKLDIPNIYTSSEDFLERYCYDESDPNSLLSNLMRAYDNAIVLREEIGSETLSYIQLAVYALNKAKISEAPLIEMQRVLDNILAFWGMADDSISDENVRNIIKVGKRIERIDLFGRLRFPKSDMLREVHRLTGRVPRTQMKYNKEGLERLNALAEAPELDYYEIVCQAECII